MKKSKYIVTLLFTVCLAGVWFATHANTSIDIPGTIAELQQRSAEGDAEATFRLATMYEVGYDSIEADAFKSLALYRQSAEAGYVPAMNFLGYRLILESDTNANRLEEGLSWLKKAADAGDAKAASNVGWIYIEGKYLPQDYSEGAGWLQKASDMNLPVASSILGDLYRYGQGVEKNEVTADSLYRASFERGLTDAAYKLFDLNTERYAGLPADSLINEGLYYYTRTAPSAGVKLFYMAADKGSADALALLGDAYTRALGVAYDYNLSNEYYIRAALAGNTSAQFIVGELLEIFPDALNNYKIGEDTRFSDPLYWYEKAAEQGVTDAEQAMNKLLSPH